MKTSLLILSFLLTAAAAFGQGTITFANTTLSRVMIPGPGSLSYIPVPLGAPIVYGVFWGVSADSLMLNAGPLGTASTTSAGIIATTSPYIIEGAAPGSSVFMKIAGWSSSFGRDFEAACRTPGAYYGETGVRQITLGPTAGPGTIIWSASNTLLFQPLKLDGFPCPEPSTMALSLLGVVVLVFRRRRRFPGHDQVRISDRKMRGSVR
jgi:hypothetical protein